MPLSILYVVLIKFCTIGRWLSHWRLAGSSLAFFIMRGALKYPSAKVETAETGKNKIYFQFNQ